MSSHGSTIDPAGLGPTYLPPGPASRISYAPGGIAQCDLWFPPITLAVGFSQVRKPTQSPVLTMVSGYSRWLSAVLIPTRSAADLFAGWWQLTAAHDSSHEIKQMPLTREFSQASGCSPDGI